MCLICNSVAIDDFVFDFWILVVFGVWYCLPVCLVSVVFSVATFCFDCDFGLLREVLCWYFVILGFRVCFFIVYLIMVCVVWFVTIIVSYLFFNFYLFAFVVLMFIVILIWLFLFVLQLGCTLWLVCFICFGLFSLVWFL